MTPQDAKWSYMYDNVVCTASLKLASSYKKKKTDGRFSPWSYRLSKSRLWSLIRRWEGVGGYHRWLWNEICQIIIIIIVKYS